MGVKGLTKQLTLSGIILVGVFTTITSPLPPIRDLLVTSPYNICILSSQQVMRILVRKKLSLIRKKLLS